MVLMASAGRMDYTKADSNSPRFLTRENLLLSTFERERLAETANSRHMDNMLSASGWSLHVEGDKVQEQVKESQKHLRRAEQMKFPWMKLDEYSQLGDLVAEMRDEYTRKFGDPNDPETQVKLKQAREQMKRRELEAKQKLEQKRQEVEERRKKILAKRDRFRKKTYGSKSV